jgi:glycerophosphoryl diester phosphodiesterase
VALLRAGSYAPGPLPLPLRGAAAQVPTRARIPIVDRRFLRAAHRRGLQVHVWTINDPDEMRALLDLGVDGLVTDRPSQLKAVLTERGQWVQ